MFNLKVLRDLWENHRSWVISIVGGILFLAGGSAVTLFMSDSGSGSSASAKPNAAVVAPSFAQSPAPQVAGQESEPEQDQAQEQEHEKKPTEWCLYITGAVRNPDVYYLPEGSRLHHLVAAAGGFNNFADREAVNLAEHLEDGWHVHIPRKGENKNANASASNIIIVEEAPVHAPGMSVQTSAPTRVQAIAPTQRATQVSVGSAGGVININRANEQELQAIKGIGPAFAKRIVEYRQKYGAFARIEDIMKVRGIGAKTFEKMKGQITVR